MSYLLRRRTRDDNDDDDGNTNDGEDADGDDADGDDDAEEKEIQQTTMPTMAKKRDERRTKKGLLVRCSDPS